MGDRLFFSTVDQVMMLNTAKPSGRKLSPPRRSGRMNAPVWLITSLFVVGEELLQALGILHIHDLLRAVSRQRGPRHRRHRSRRAAPRPREVNRGYSRFVGLAKRLLLGGAGDARAGGALASVCNRISRI